MYLTNKELANIKGGFIGIITQFGRTIFEWGITLGNKLRNIVDMIKL